MSSAALLAMGDRPIAFHPNLCRVAGSLKAGLFLSQALYWQNRVPPDRDGWWWHTQDEWTNETTMSRKECDSARAALRKLGVLETQRIGMPAKSWYRVDVDVLGLLLEALVEQRDENYRIDGGGPCAKGAIKSVQKGQSELPQRDNHSFNTEITTENNQGGGSPNGQTEQGESRCADQPVGNRKRPGLVSDPAELVDLAEYVADQAATAQGRDKTEAMTNHWLAQLRVLVAGGLSVGALRAGWEYGRGHDAYKVPVMSPGGFNRHHEGLIASALSEGKAGGGLSGPPQCRGVGDAECDQPATMGASGRNTHCADCHEAEADAQIARLLGDEQ